MLVDTRNTLNSETFVHLYKARRAAAARNPCFIQPLISIPASGVGRLGRRKVVSLRRATSPPLISPASAGAVEEVAEELAAWLGLGPVVRVSVKG